jgi:hypothetical protein
MMKILKRMSRSHGTVSPFGRGRQFLGAKRFDLPSLCQLQSCRGTKSEVKFCGCNFLYGKRRESGGDAESFVQGPTSVLVSRLPSPTVRRPTDFAFCLPE